MDERVSFLDQFPKLPFNKSSIYVFDRGYYSKNLITYLEDNNVKYVCRLKENSLLLEKNKTDYIKKVNYIVNKVNKECLIRILKYKINETTYRIATNLFEESYTIDTLGQIYHDR